MTKTPTLPVSEWTQQSRILIGWPSHAAPWEDEHAGAFDAARTEAAGLVQALVGAGDTMTAGAPSRVVLVLEGEAARADAMSCCGSGFDILDLACGDIWIRDTGPLFSVRGGALSADIFVFNGWGGKYNYAGDAALGGMLASHLAKTLTRHDFILEGGGIENDGAGLILATRECLLNPNRNTGWTQTLAETHLREALGAEKIIWLGEGLHNDHTDGHVDNIARWLGPGHVLCQTANGEDDPNADRLATVEQTLRSATDIVGNALVVDTIPSPGLVTDADDKAAPASHMNFIVTNQAVIVPVFNQAGAIAARSLSGIVTDRPVLISSASALLVGGGAFHCMSQHIPAA